MGVEPDGAVDSCLCSQGLGSCPTIISSVSPALKPSLAGGKARVAVALQRSLAGRSKSSLPDAGAERLLSRQGGGCGIQ